MQSKMVINLTKYGRCRDHGNEKGKKNMQENRNPYVLFNYLPVPFFNEKEERM